MTSNDKFFLGICAVITGCVLYAVSLPSKSQESLNKALIDTMELAQKDCTALHGELYSVDHDESSRWFLDTSKVYRQYFCRLPTGDLPMSDEFILYKKRSVE